MKLGAWDCEMDSNIGTWMFIGAFRSFYEVCDHWRSYNPLFGNEYKMICSYGPSMGHTLKYAFCGMMENIFYSLLSHIYYQHECIYGVYWSPTSNSSNSIHGSVTNPKKQLKLITNSQTQSMV